MEQHRNRKTLEYNERELEEISFRYCNEETHRDGGDDKRTSKGLDEDGILNLAESWFLDPNLTIENLTDHVSFLILSNPWFVFVAVTSAHRVK